MAGKFATNGVSNGPRRVFGAESDPRMAQTSKWDCQGAPRGGFKSANSGVLGAHWGLVGPALRAQEA